jgi:hypothetical protein
MLFSSFSPTGGSGLPVTSVAAPANMRMAPMTVAAPYANAGAVVLAATPIQQATGNQRGGYGAVNIHNYSGAKIDAERVPDGRGGMDLKVTVRDAMREAVTSGALDTQMRTAFGLRRRMT